MSEKIGRFEIVSQLAQPPFATVYKAVDSENQQTVALKVVELTKVKDREGLLKNVFAEADQAKPLNSHNIAALYGVGDEADQLLSATEYVQGNSIATTLARREGFSIWDIQDVARQVCHALDHAHVHNVVHLSLEPAKIMVQWDGLVKVLGFGISSMNGLTESPIDRIPDVLYYASPEQLRGEPCDHRSMLFTLGAILYEMAVEQKPFPGDTTDQVREAILEKLPVQPVRLKANLSRGLSDLIMKALAKNPDERYQSGQELIRDLEQCRAGASTPTQPITPQPQKSTEPAGIKPKAFAAAAGAGSTTRTSPASISIPKISASAAPAVEEQKPGFAVDPMMAGEGSGTAPTKSFSDIAELPPLKEVHIGAPTPEPLEQSEPEPLPASTFNQKVEPEKPKAQIRETAKKAVREIRKTPPKLYLYAVAGAIGLILIIVAGMVLHTYLQDRDESGGSIQQITGAPVQRTPAQRAAASAPAPPAQQPQTAEPAPATAQDEPDPQDSTNALASHGRTARKRKQSAAPAVVNAQLTVNSTPAGAEIAFDGTSLCQSPCTLTGIAPGQHTISASKAGFASTTRNLSLASGANATIDLELGQLSSVLSVASTPAGAVIIIDGKDTGKLTPFRFAVSVAGNHTIMLRRAGYLDASSTVTIALGQNSNVNLPLTHLGNTDEIRAAGGKFKKLFGGGGETAGMGIVSIKTQPKGAQILVNSRVLDKTSPFDFYLNPGTYVVDITMDGYRPIHRVITVQEGEKFAIQETLSPN